MGAVITSILFSGSQISEADLELAISDAMDEAVSEAVERATQSSRSELTLLVDEMMAAERAQIEDLFQRVSPSVVVIDAEGPERTNDEGIEVVPAAIATGFVLDSDGHIVTAAHVLEGMTTFEVILHNDERRRAERIGDDQPFSDVAVLRLEEPILGDDDAHNLLVPSFGATNSIETGQTVLAIGNTLLGQEISVTVGVVSDPDTSFFRERYEQDNLIQTDAALNHGNSGGILADLDGNIVGMTAVIARETRDGEFVDGVGFAIQIDAVLEVARAIAEDGYYPRPTFGVVNERLLTPTAAAQLDLEVTQGSFLIEIRRGGAFARAGIRPGDVLRELNGVRINADSPYLNALATLEPLVPVTVHVHRGGEEYRLSIAPDLRAP